MLGNVSTLMSLHPQTVATVFLGISHLLTLPHVTQKYRLDFVETAVVWGLFIFLFLTVSVLLNVASLMVFKGGVGPPTGFCWYSQKHVFFTILPVEFPLSNKHIFTHFSIVVLLDVATVPTCYFPTTFFTVFLTGPTPSVWLHHCLPLRLCIKRQSGLVMYVSVFDLSSELEKRQYPVTGTSFGF